MRAGEQRVRTGIIGKTRGLPPGGSADAQAAVDEADHPGEAVVQIGVPLDPRETSSMAKPRMVLRIVRMAWVISSSPML